MNAGFPFPLRMKNNTNLCSEIWFIIKSILPIYHTGSCFHAIYVLRGSWQLCKDIGLYYQYGKGTKLKWTHWSLNKWSIFYWWHLAFWLEFHRSLFWQVQLTIGQLWFRQRLGTCSEPSHYLNQWWHSSLKRWASPGLNEFKKNVFLMLRSKYKWRAFSPNS